MVYLIFAFKDVVGVFALAASLTGQVWKTLEKLTDKNVS